MSNARNTGMVNVDAVHAEEVVRSAKRELSRLLAQRAAITREIGTVKQTLVGLGSIFGDQIFDAELLEWLGRAAPRRGRGFTEACRVVLMESGEPLTAKEIYNRMQKRFAGVIESHKDPIASVTTVLTRLVSYGEVERIVNDHGRPRWQWIAGAQPTEALSAEFPRAFGGPARDRESESLAARHGLA